jgi:transcriptional regulator of acetoin/glycerol metabolism
VLGHNIPVLIEGDSGTGKELFAQAMHRSGPRRNGSFVALNCAALPEGLIEAELFGYEEGAFTGANARRHGRSGKPTAGPCSRRDRRHAVALRRLLRILRSVPSRRWAAANHPVIRLICATSAKSWKIAMDVFAKTSIIASTA